MYMDAMYKVLRAPLVSNFGTAAAYYPILSYPILTSHMDCLPVPCRVHTQESNALETSFVGGAPRSPHRAAQKSLPPWLS